jgi:hypothetical protein
MDGSQAGSRRRAIERYRPVYFVVAMDKTDLSSNAVNTKPRLPPAPFPTKKTKLRRNII